MCTVAFNKFILLVIIINKFQRLQLTYLPTMKLGTAVAQKPPDAASLNSKAQERRLSAPIHCSFEALVALFAL